MWVTDSQPWLEMATRIVEIMKTRTCSHICWDDLRHSSLAAASPAGI